jgi:hypothetical protein
VILQSNNNALAFGANRASKKFSGVTVRAPRFETKTEQMWHISCSNPPHILQLNALLDSIVHFIQDVHNSSSPSSERMAASAATTAIIILLPVEACSVILSQHSVQHSAAQCSIQLC